MSTTSILTLPRIGVLAVQGDVREHLAALDALGADAVTVRRPAEVQSIDGLVIPGGESTVMDKLVRAFDLREPLLRRIAEGMPAYGSCAGMIMLADRIADGRPDQQTLGGLDITVRRNAFGRQVDSFEQDLDYAWRAATSMFLMSLAKSLPRLASLAAFWCFVVAHLEWPLMQCPRVPVTGVRPTAGVGAL